MLAANQMILSYGGTCNIILSPDANGNDVISINTQDSNGSFYNGVYIGGNRVATVNDIPSLSGYATQTWVGNNYSKLLAVSSTTISISVPANDKVTSSFGVSKTGYKPLGVVGHTFPSSSFMTLSRSYVSGNTYNYQAKNHNSSAYSGDFTVYILYVKE
jgi:hypothetical protein